MVLLRDSVNLLPLPIEGFRAAAVMSTEDAVKKLEDNATKAKRLKAEFETALSAAIKAKPADKAGLMKTAGEKLNKIRGVFTDSGPAMTFLNNNIKTISDATKKRANEYAKAIKAARDNAATKFNAAKTTSASSGTTPADNVAMAKLNSGKAADSYKRFMAASAAATKAGKDKVALDKAINSMKSELKVLATYASVAANAAQRENNPEKKKAAGGYAAAAKKSRDDAATESKKWTAALASAVQPPSNPVALAKEFSDAAVKAVAVAKERLGKTINTKDRAKAEDFSKQVATAAKAARDYLTKIRALMKANTKLAAQMKASETAAAAATTEAEGYAVQAIKIAALQPSSVTVSGVNNPSGPSGPVITPENTQTDALAKIKETLDINGKNFIGLAGGVNGTSQNGGVNMPGGGGGGGMYPGAFLGGGGVGAVSGGAMLSGQGILYPNGGYMGYPQLGAVTSAYVPPPSGFLADSWPPLSTTTFGLTPPCSQDVYISPNSAFAGPPLGSSQQFYGQNLQAQAGPQSMTLIPPSPQPRVTSGAPPARPDLDPVPDGPAYIQQS